MQRQDPKEQKELPTIINRDEVSSVGRYSLQVGQWIIFYSDKPIETLTKLQKDIYNKLFLVVTRADFSFDTCSFTLIGQNGKIYDYCPELYRLEDVSLSDKDEIFVVLSKKIQSIFGKEKLESIYVEAQKYLDSMADDFKEYSVEKLEVESLKNKLHSDSQKDEKDYSLYCIPPAVLRFFSEEKGLNPEMLLKNGYLGLQKKNSCDMIDAYKHLTIPLIKFYLKTPQLSVESLLNYDQYAIREFALYDTNFQFHRWLLDNNLTMPSALVKIGGHGRNISDLCDSSGIEYLTRKILSLSKVMQQSKLNELVTGDCYRDKAICLRDSLVSSSEVSWDTVEKRFLKFKAKEKAVAEKYTTGLTSLMWLCAKKASKNITQEQFDELPENVQLCVKAAKPF